MTPDAQNTPNTRRTFWRAIALSLLPSLVLVMTAKDAYLVDFSALYFAAEFYAQADWANIYPPSPEFFWDPAPDAWRERAAREFAAQGATSDIVTPYVYPPIWAALMAPFTAWVPFGVASHILIAVNAAALVAIIWMGYHLMAHEDMQLTHWSLMCVGLSIYSIAFVLAFLLGQPQVVVNAMILGSMVLLLRGHDVSAGGLLAFAAAIKLAPAIFAILFVMEKRWTALVSFVIIGAGLALCSVMITGWPLHDAFLSKLAQLDGQTLLSRINLSLDQPLYHLNHLLTGRFENDFTKPELFDAPAWTGLTLRLVLLAGLVWIYRATRTLPDDKRLGRRVLSLSLLLILTSPLSWVHYMMLPLILLPGLWGGRGFLPFYGLCVLVFSPHVFTWLSAQQVGFLLLPALYCGTALIAFILSVTQVPLRSTSAHNRA